MIRRLTLRQREMLERIASIVESQGKRLLADWPGCTPSKWVFLVELTETHHLRRDVINQLVAKGYLDKRPTDGWGPEVKVREQV